MTTQEIVTAALAFVEEKKKEGWTRAEFAEALKKMLNEDNPDETAKVQEQS